VIGGVFDGLMLVPMLFPPIGARMLRLQHFCPGPDYGYAMNVAASLMLGWALLLFWAARRPAERAAVLLLTVVVVCGLAISSIVGMVSGFMPFAGALPMLVAQLGLVGLFLGGFLRVTADPAGDRSAR
jgi:hypothetical protein